MALLDRSSLLKRDELKIEKVILSKDDFVFVREMTGRERDQFETSLIREVKRPNGEVEYVRSLEDFKAKLAVNSLCNEKGDLLLKPHDYQELSKNIAADKLQKIVEVALSLNGMGEEDLKKVRKN